MYRMLMLNCRFKRANSLTISACVTVSSALVGSSATSRAGRCTMVIAMSHADLCGLTAQEFRFGRRIHGVEQFEKAAPLGKALA